MKKQSTLTPESIVYDGSTGLPINDPADYLPTVSAKFAGSRKPKTKKQQKVYRLYAGALPMPALPAPK